MKRGGERHAGFVREIEAAATRRRASDALVDAVHLMALSIWGALCPAAEKEAVERDFEATRGKYGDEEYGHFVRAFAELADALSADRSEFLGWCMTTMDATNKWGGQFLTPNNIAKMLGAVLASGETRDGVIRLGDPCVGAGVTVIEGAEEMMAKGVPQRDILIDCGDIDGRACDMAYVQLSLLGYAAVVRHRNALTLEDFSPPRLTPGWFLHGFPLRGIGAA